MHCAASGLKYPPLVPIWGPSAITLQPIRAGFPCFGAALAGYVEATREDDAEKNRLCPPTPYPNTLAEWASHERAGHPGRDVVRVRARHQGLGRRGRAQPGAYPARDGGSAELDDALARLQTHAPAGWPGSPS